MGFKVNLWTWLFFLSLSFILYSNLKTEKNIEITGEQTNCDTIPNYQIEDSLALEYISAYSEFLKGNIIVNNPNVIYFNLPRCEINEMLNTIGPEADIKAHLAVKDAGQSVDGIDLSVVLIFEDQKKVGEEKIGFFDFTTPCPNFCYFTE